MCFLEILNKLKNSFSNDFYENLKFCFSSFLSVIHEISKSEHKKYAFKYIVIMRSMGE